MSDVSTNFTRKRNNADIGLEVSVKAELNPNQ